MTINASLEHRLTPADFKRPEVYALPILRSTDHPFRSVPALAEIKAEKVSTDGMILPSEYNPHNVRPWVLGDVSGPIAVVWAECEQDAWDNACDGGFLDSHQVEESAVKPNEDGDEEADDGNNLMRLGNASEPFTFDQPWMGIVDLCACPVAFLMALAEARGNGNATLGD